MNTYAIRRKQAWQSPEEVQQVAGRSKQVANEEFPSDVRWIRSYVLAEKDGRLGSVCIYQATSPEEIRNHAHRVGMPADEIFPVGETVVIRADPASEPAASWRLRRAGGHPGRPPSATRWPGFTTPT